MADIRVTGLLDNFTRADENPLSHGGDWQPLGTTFNQMQIISNLATNANGSGQRTAWSVWDPLSLDNDVECWGVTAGAASSNAFGWRQGLFADYTGGFDGYDALWVNTNTGDACQIRRNDNGSATLLKNQTPIALPNAGDILLLRTNGNDIEAWRSTDSGANWTMIANATDSTYRSGLHLSLGVQSNTTSGPRWGQFGGGVPIVRRKTQIYRYVTT